MIKFIKEFHFSLADINEALVDFVNKKSPDELYNETEMTTKVMFMSGEHPVILTFGQAVNPEDYD